MPIELNPEQRRQAIEIMQNYLTAPPNADGRTIVEVEADLNNNRVAVIESELEPLLVAYLAGDLALSDFKTKVDGINKRNRFWGFNGTKGQMFFNLVLNVAEDAEECDQAVKSAIEMPLSDEIASTRIKTFSSYVKGIGDSHVQSGGTKQSKPNLSSVPFFLSYFWQIQKRDVWPIYYTNSVNVMNDLNLWQPSGDLAADYITYKGFHDELVRVFTAESGKKFSLYDVEHVFWFHGGKSQLITKPIPKEGSLEGTPNEEKSQDDAREISPIQRLPESYIPPIVAILPNIARNEPQLREAAKGIWHQP